MKSPVLGRKNYLFCGSDAGGQRAACMYTIVKTAKMNGVNPQAYLTDVLSRIAEYPIQRIDDAAALGLETLADLTLSVGHLMPRSLADTYCSPSPLGGWEATYRRWIDPQKHVAIRTTKRLLRKGWRWRPPERLGAQTFAISGSAVLRRTTPGRCFVFRRRGQPAQGFECS
jgi:IS66 C-terminal element